MKTLPIEKKFTIKTSFGTTQEVAIQLNKYSANDSLAIQMLCDGDGYIEPWQNLTVCIPGYPLADNQVFIDTNNNGNVILEFVDTIGKRIGYGFSGFCKYPLYELDIDKVNSLAI